MDKIKKILDKIFYKEREEILRELDNWIPPPEREEELQSIVVAPGVGSQPAIPWKGKCLPIPKNLAGQSPYLMGLGSTFESTRVGDQIFAIGSLLNNITEMLSYISQQRLKGSENSIKKDIKDLENRTVENLEVNRLDIKKEINSQFNLNKENIKGLEIATERLEKIFLENSTEDKTIKELSEVTSLVNKIITDLEESKKKFNNLEEKLDNFITYIKERI